VGVLVLSKNHRIVAGCISCFVGGGGHELDIWTSPNHRQQGLAWYCAARALQIVLASAPEARLYANWSCDVDKEASKKIGARLGFELLGVTTTFSDTGVPACTDGGAI
jgi:RimJ/RimL family protein N-acetyltransferase